MYVVDTQKFHLKEHAKHMLELFDKEIFTILHSKIFVDLKGTSFSYLVTFHYFYRYNMW